MINYDNQTICKIADPEFQSMIRELCHCTNLDLADVEDNSLVFFLMAIDREKRALTRQHLPTDGILTRKVNKLADDSVVLAVCREMIRQKKTSHIENFDGKTVLSLINHCYKSFFPKPARPKKLKPHQLRHQIGTQLIKRRRRNGTL